MLQRFEPEEAARVATDSIYVRKSALHKAFVAPKRCDCGEVGCVLCLLGEDYDAPVKVAPGQWRDKGENVYMPMKHAAYRAKPDYKATKKDLTPSTAPRHNDPLSRHRLSYPNGGGGSGKTTRAIELFRRRNPLVVNLKELRSPQGAPLVNPSQAIGDLCRSLASQRLSLFVARGHFNDRESVAEGFPPYAVVWQKEQVRLVDLVGHRHVKLRPRYAPLGRQIDLQDGLLLQPLLGSVALAADASFLMAVSPLQ